MNQVNLIGKLCSEPKYRLSEDGRKIAKFTLSTHEIHVNEEGNPQKINYWHKLIAWGNDINILQNEASKGKQIAVDGRLSTKFYKDKQGIPVSSSEVLVNSLYVI